jgi:adenine-specific DNA-methyltransferase
MRIHHQVLPAAGPEREALRRKGQFWTPQWVAEAMVTYAVAGGSDHIFDPAVGAGAFFRAAKKVSAEKAKRLKLLGSEIDGEALYEARRGGLTDADLSGVTLTDFVLRPPQSRFSAIVANPPYIRHHRLSAETKVELKRFSASFIGATLDGRAGLHVYFLLRGLQLLAGGGRLAFVMPADTCEGVFASTLWAAITRNYRLEAVVTFASEASPFPGVDTNPIVFLISNTPPAEHFLWAKCLEPDTDSFTRWVASGFEEADGGLEVHRRPLSEGLETGLSREPVAAIEGESPPLLSDYARVMRGIATGANDFFFLTAARARELKLPDEFLLPAVGRTRDVAGDEIGTDSFRALDAAGRPTLLFSPDGRPLEFLPEPVRRYLLQGEAEGIHRKTLIATRRPWYKMETRPAPPFLFAYLGRRHARFIRNSAGAVPLTGFLCVYPYARDEASLESLWRVLRHPETVANLALVGKSYGGGAIKVEPRSLERLPLSHAALREGGLTLLPLSHARVKPDRQPFLPLS